ncbi:MAG TPA: dethiobiotin synthase [Puia sp.]|nr:dethiobiotin synthase [Puia sp.]
MRPIFISGIGTGIGKTLVAAIITEALKADYWKPVQAGYEPGTDSRLVASLVSNSETVIHPETYLLKLAASPHIAAQRENRRIELKKIADDLNHMDGNRPLVIEGAGGLMVPLNEQEFVIDLVKMLDARLVLVSRNYLGSINHSLMTAAICRQYGLDVAGWVFNDQYMNYEHEIVRWSGYPALFSLPLMNTLSKQTILAAAESIPPEGMGYLCESL